MYVCVTISKCSWLLVIFIAAEQLCDSFAAGKAGKKAAEDFDLVRDIDQVLPIEVKEQRMSNLLQSLMIALCLRKFCSSCHFHFDMAEMNLLYNKDVSHMTCISHWHNISTREFSLIANRHFLAICWHVLMYSSLETLGWVDTAVLATDTLASNLAPYTLTTSATHIVDVYSKLDTSS